MAHTYRHRHREPRGYVTAASPGGEKEDPCSSRMKPRFQQLRLCSRTSLTARPLLLHTLEQMVGNCRLHQRVFHPGSESCSGRDFIRGGSEKKGGHTSRVFPKRNEKFPTELVGKRAHKQVWQDYRSTLPTPVHLVKVKFALCNYAKHAPLAKSAGTDRTVCNHSPAVSVSPLCSLHLLSFVFQNGVKHLSRQFNIYLPKVNSRSLKTSIRYALRFLFADGNTGLAGVDDVSYLRSPIFHLSK